jgi:PE-PPE domain
MKKALAAAVAAGATGVLAFGSAIPADAVPLYLYAGGTRQSGQPSETSANEWRAFLGENHAPAAFTVQYPRDLAPLIGDKTLDDSVADGVTAALDLIGEHDDGTSMITLAGVSQGAVVMAKTKQDLIDDGVDPKRITVATFGDPTNPDGGFLSKLDRWNASIPGYTPVTHAPGDGAYATFVIEYDLIADSPDNLNPVSWANALMGATYDHPTYSLELVEKAAADGRVVANTEEWIEVSDNQVETDLGYYQHNMIKQENLPVTRPLRDIGSAIADDQDDVAVNRVVDQLDNVLRPIVDAGYDGGGPGGTRHVGTVIRHYRDEDGYPVANPNQSLAGGPVGAKPKTPLRDAVKTVRNEVKKLRDSLKPKDNED